MLLGIPGDNTYSNYAEANRAFYRQTGLEYERPHPHLHGARRSRASGLVSMGVGFIGAVAADIA